MSNFSDIDMDVSNNLHFGMINSSKEQKEKNERLIQTNYSQNGGADNDKLTMDIPRDQLSNDMDKYRYQPLKCNYNTDAMNYIRTGDDTKINSDNYSEYATDLFFEMENNNMLINYDTLPFQRGGVSTRRMDSVKTNH